VHLKSDENLRSLFLSALRSRYVDSRAEIHVSDLVYCLREAYFRKIEPVDPTLKQLGFFVDGARRHKVLQEILGVECEVEVKRYGVVGHIDVMLDAPVEIKTTRARSALPDHYFRQLGFYAVMMNARHGYLVIQRLNAAEDPWEFYRVEWTEEEIKEIDRELKRRADQLRAALNFHDPSMLPEIEEDMRWKCRSCLYRERCKGRIQHERPKEAER